MLVVGMDTKGVDVGTQRMQAEIERGVRSGIASFKRLDAQVASSAAKMAAAGGAASGGRGGKAGKGIRGGGWVVGGVAMQLQDVAVQMEQGTNMARIIAQQGSQIASYFGPAGMVLGGVVAIGAAIYSWYTGLDKALGAAKRFHEHQMEQIRDQKKLTADTEKAMDDSAVLETRIRLGNEAADAKERELKLAKELKDIEDSSATQGMKIAAKQEQIRNSDLHEELRQKGLSQERSNNRVSAMVDSLKERQGEILMGHEAVAARDRKDRTDARAMRRAAEEDVSKVDTRLRKQTGLADDRGLTDDQKKDMIGARLDAAAYEKAKKGDRLTKAEKQRLTAKGIDPVKLKQGGEELKLAKESIDDFVKAIEKLITK